MVSADNKPERSTLHIDSTNFVAKPYLEFIHNLKTDRKKTLDDSKISSKSKSKEHINLNQ